MAESDPDSERPITASERASLLRENQDRGDTDREIGSLKREFDNLRETVAELRAERQQSTDQLYQTLRGLGLSGEEIEANVRALAGHGLTRRAAMLAIVGAVGGAGFMSGRASADASTSDGDGDVGTPSDRVDVFADGISVNEINNVVKVRGDNGSDIFDALNTRIAEVESGSGLPGTRFDVEPGEYTASTELDFADKGTVNNCWIDLRGVTVTFSGSGNNAIDATGTHNAPHIIGGRITGAGTDTPAVGLLFARHGTVADSAGGKTVMGLRIDGNWTTAAYYNYASEATHLISPRFSNSEAGTPTVIHTPDNHENVTSSFATVGTSAASNTYFSYVNADIRNDDGEAVYLRGSIADLSFAGQTYIHCDGTAAVFFDLASDVAQRVSFQGLRVEGSPTYGVRVEGSTLIQWLTMENPALEGSTAEISFQSGTAALGCDFGSPQFRGAQTVVLEDFRNSYLNAAPWDGSVTVNGEYNRGSEIRVQTTSDLTINGTPSSPAFRTFTVTSSTGSWQFYDDDGGVEAWVDIV